MFTGIVTEVGKILHLSDTASGRYLVIGAALAAAGLQLGESISVSGTCLTVVASDEHSFQVELSPQTLRCTKQGYLKVGDPVNLERALRVGDRLGGHLVTGHVDSVGTVFKQEQQGFSRLVTFAVTSELSAYFIEKGSVTVDGVSLTVASLPMATDSNQQLFTVALIPHTMKVTTLGQLQPGDVVNVETDLLGKYASRWLEPVSSASPQRNKTNLSSLVAAGYL